MISTIRSLWPDWTFPRRTALLCLALHLVWFGAQFAGHYQLVDPSRTLIGGLAFASVSSLGITLAMWMLPFERVFGQYFRAMETAHAGSHNADRRRRRGRRKVRRLAP